MSSGALDSSGVLLSYSITVLASPMTCQYTDIYSQTSNIHIYISIYLQANYLRSMVYNSIQYILLGYPERLKLHGLLWVCLCLFLGFNGLVLYTAGVLFHVECCIKQLWHSFTITRTSLLYHNTIILIFPLINNKNIDELDSLWLPLVKTWRLNERMYGALTGLSKKMIKEKHGDAQFMKWRRGYVSIELSTKTSNVGCGVSSNVSINTSQHKSTINQLFHSICLCWDVWDVWDI